MLENYFEITIRLVIAIVLGGAIGIERAGRNHEAGMRTHILVCLGACGIMVMSEAMFSQFGGDISRIGAQVVSGIGFLGTGCILVTGNRIKGLTTAAGLWTTACVGLSVGIGYYFIGIAITVLMLVTMLILKPIGEFIQKKWTRDDRIVRVYFDENTDFEKVIKLIDGRDAQIISVKRKNSAIKLKITDETEIGISRMIIELMKNEFVNKVERL